MHGMMSDGIRRMLALVIVLYILLLLYFLLYCMIANGSLFAGLILQALGIAG